MRSPAEVIYSSLVEVAYLRTDVLQYRAPMMRDWANFADKPLAKDAAGNIVGIHAQIAVD